MSRRYTGGCACGALRYETGSEPVFQHHCQCLHCQKRSGTGHSSYLTFPRRADFAISGEARTRQVEGDSGKGKIHAFCPTCGTPVYATFAAAPEAIAIHATSLDDPSLFEPQVITYGARGLGWDAMDPSLRWFEGMPPG